MPWPGPNRSPFPSACPTPSRRRHCGWHPAAAVSRVSCWSSCGQRWIALLTSARVRRRLRWSSTRQDAVATAEGRERGVLEQAGRILRAQASRKKVFQTILPLLTAGLIRPADGKRPAKKRLSADPRAGAGVADRAAGSHPAPEKANTSALPVGPVPSRSGRLDPRRSSRCSRPRTCASTSSSRRSCEYSSVRMQRYNCFSIWCQVSVEVKVVES
jgi:hypothetical protein